MAKKSKKPNKKSPVNELPDNMLPQNILPIGERVEENTNIYISQAVYKEIHKFTKNKTTNESGGMLVGSIMEEFGKTNIIISGFVEAKFCEATPTTLKFTHKTWEFVHKEIDNKFKGKKIVGWIHTHPDFGIFLSEYDKFIHQNFFSEAYQVAYVVDPIQHMEGFYFWINGSIEKCKGFYIYDKTGTQITVDAGKDEPAAEKAEDSLFSITNFLIAILSVAVVFLLFSNISASKKLEKIREEQETLETQQQRLAGSANLALSQMQQMISTQEAEIENLKDILTNAGILAEPETPNVPEDNASNGPGTDDVEGGAQGEPGETMDDAADEAADTTGTAEGGDSTNE